MRQYATVYLVSRLQSELDRFFSEAGEMAGAESAPALDILETKDALKILIEVPGGHATDLVVETRGRRLTVSGSRSAGSPRGEDVRFLCMERGQGRFERSIIIPARVDPYRGQARLSRGVLEIDLPKVGDRRGRVHHIKIEETESGQPS